MAAMSMDATPPTLPASPETTADASKPPAPAWEPLSPVERRIIGVLMEKQRTSKGEAEPLTLNALVAGCNQKTNRDPIFDLPEAEADETAKGLQRRGLVTRVIMGRADRFRPEVASAWSLRILEQAVVAELLLRGPQTKGDLRVRASRMNPINTLEELDEVLQPLVERGLAVYLTEPERRGAIVTHGFHPPEELARLRAHHAHAPASVSGPDSPASRPPASGDWEGRLAAALGEIDALKARVASLESHVADLRRQLDLPAA
jgi:uncharacterized protein YceH (UPF0502 family)